MSQGRPGSPLATSSNAQLVGGWRGILRGGEDLLLILALAAMMVLPLAEMMFRAGLNEFVQHLTLIVGMLGGAIAARENRLLSLSSVTTFLKGRAQSISKIFSHAFSAAVCLVLCWASIQFLRTEEKVLAYGVPVWAVQLILPIGYSLIGLRLLWLASEKWSGRGLGCCLASGLIAIALWSPLSPEHLVWPGLLLLLAATVLGAPIFTTIAGATLILLWGADSPMASIPLKHYSLVTNPSLPSIPLFTLAGYFLAEGGASKRLIRVFQSLVGQVRGGSAIMVVLVCAFFTSFTGASGVTILALGGLLMPVLLSAGYSERNAMGLLTGAGSLGVLFPPCLPLILYAIIAGGAVANLDVASASQAGISLQQMFLGGAIPGLLLVGLTGWLGFRQESSSRGARKQFSASEAGQAVWEAKWEVLLPVVAVVALFSGYATPVEAAAITACYAFIVEACIYRDLKWTKDIPRAMTECGLLVGGVLVILGVAMGFTNYLVLEQIPAAAVEWVTHSIHSRWVFLLALNFFLLLVGCLMDIYSAIVVVVPLIVPMGMAFGIDPIHLGIIFLANLQLGYLTPPVGMNLFLASYRFGKPISEVIRSVLPVFLVLLIGVLLITYVPALSTLLPRIFAGH